ncbi:hypothetical protein ACHAWF_002165 [Thalassiosira exigua]
MGAHMQRAIRDWPSVVQKNHENFAAAGIIHYSFHLDYTHSGDKEDAIEARADISRENMEVLEARRRRNLERQEQREKGGGDENEDDEERSSIQIVVPDHFEPYEWTRPIRSAGWYRMCAISDNKITVEMDIRSGAELGGIDQDSKHVYTRDEREYLDEERRIMGLEQEAKEAKAVVEELEKVLKDQISDYDLEGTRKLTSEVNRLVSEMQRRQQSAQKRMKGHEGDARRNYKRIVRSGQMETVLYVLITLFQVRTVHKWLLSQNVLGRA